MKRVLSILLFVFAVLFIPSTVEASCCGTEEEPVKEGYSEVPTMKYKIWVKKMGSDEFILKYSDTVPLHFKWHSMYEEYKYSGVSEGYGMSNISIANNYTSSFVPTMSSYRHYISSSFPGAFMDSAEKLKFYPTTPTNWNKFENYIGLTMDNYEDLVVNFIVDEAYLEYTASLYDTNNSNKRITTYNYTIADTIQLPTVTDSMKKGYILDYWYTVNKYDIKLKEYTSIPEGTVGNLDLYSHYALQNYDINYNLNGGTNNSNNPITYTVESNSITLKSPSKAGYVFDGWFLDDDYSKAIETIETGTTGNLELYAKFTPINYTITYKDVMSGVTNSNPITYNVEMEDIILQPLDNVEGYLFTGWTMNSDSCTEIDTALMQNIELKANWEECLHINTITVEQKDATCTQQGYTGDVICSDCNKTVSYGTYTSTIAHNKDVIKNAKEPTCNEIGYTGDKYCSTCDQLQEEGTELEATGNHSIEIRDSKDAKCNEEGYTGDKYCSICDTLQEKGTVIQATEKHNTEIRDKKVPTCAVKGYTGDTYCKDCNELITKGSDIPVVNEHIWFLMSVKPATTTEEGTKNYCCSVCGAEKSETIPQIENTDNSNNQNNDAIFDTKQDATDTTAKQDATDTTAKQEVTDTTQKTIKEVQKVKATINSLTNKTGKKIAIKFKKKSGYKYQIKVSTDKKFKKSVKTYKTSKTSYTVKNLKKGKKYYVKVRTYKSINGKTYYGKWSKVKWVKIKK